MNGKAVKLMLHQSMCRSQNSFDPLGLVKLIPGFMLRKALWDAVVAGGEMPFLSGGFIKTFIKHNSNSIALPSWGL